MIRIEILSGPESGRVLELATGTHSVGRASSNDVVLAVDSVSGNHLQLEVVGDKVRFRDLGSTNGTWSGGVQVQEGEWFDGSELKLGSLRLRLSGQEGAASAADGSEDSDGSESAEDAALHRRAREAAMGGKRKGGLLTLLAVLLIAGGGAGWWFLLRDDSPPMSNTGGEAGVTAAATTASTDVLEGFGQFGDEGAWSLDQGLSLSDGRLQSSQEKGGLARLVRRFAAPLHGLRFQADVAAGLQVVPILRWGESEEDGAPSYQWQAPALGSGISVLAFPEQASWFELSLRVSGRGSVGELAAEETEAQTSPLQWGLFQGESFGANLYLANLEGPLLSARGGAGSWATTGSGLLFSPSGDKTILAIHPEAALLANGAALVLSQGGPLSFASGISLADSPGLLLGGKANRFLMRFPQATAVRVLEGAAVFSASEPLTLASDFTEDLTEAARLSQRIRRAERDGDRRGVLEAANELLRGYPFEESKMQAALLAARAALEGGRADLEDLQERSSAVLFAGSVEAMHQLAEEASALAVDLPGTEIAPEASTLALVLRGAAEQLEQEDRRARTAYRGRLEKALAGSYPALAAWLQKEAN